MARIKSRVCSIERWGKGEARGCAPRPSLHRESLALCFLCLFLGQEGRERSQPNTLSSPRLPLPSKQSPMAGSCSPAAGSFPVHLRTARGGLQYAGAASLPVPSRSVFCFSFSAGVALALTPGVHLKLGNTSPRALVRLSMFAYYKTFGPVSSLIKVRSPPPRDYRSGLRLARSTAERSTPVLPRAADPTPGAARWLSLC